MTVTSALVVMSDDLFTLDTVTVPAGQTVIWFNVGPSLHTTTSNTGVMPSWDSGSLGVGGVFPVFFSTPGTYPYHCTI
ncbi:MAG: cupredoxin domain-containing protein, partial [Gemmatimonadales bacterium]